MLTSTICAVQWVESDSRQGSCTLLDQRLLPGEERYLTFQRFAPVAQAIRDLTVRGAPAIGVAAAYAVVLAAQEALALPGGEREAFFTAAVTEIAAARPTAVNLKWAVEKMRRLVEGPITDVLVSRLLAEAKLIQKEDIESNARMAELGASLLKAPVHVAMTYCNTGDLATGGIGTAFGVLRAAYLSGRISEVFSCETRPVLQGLRLTAWELAKNKIPFTMICDNMAASVMRSGRIGSIFVGADRIALNGDAANKVGTYSLAVLAKFHNIPFYVVAPTSSFDLTVASGEGIPIEERAGEEIVGVLGTNRPLFAVKTHNPSFDVTPHELISAIVCERGIIHAPDTKNVKAVVR